MVSAFINDGFPLVKEMAVCPSPPIDTPIIDACNISNDSPSNLIEFLFDGEASSSELQLPITKIEILKTKIFEDGLEAYLKEQIIIEKFKRYKYLGEDMRWFYGYTE
ncbi:MAG: hypothetical protein KAI99_16475, partial [Cyclobacteriaceae bacterium]|nr:hypothetical protein [Cyclobacteriaceae bacterium]